MPGVPVEPGARAAGRKEKLLASGGILTSLSMGGFSPCGLAVLADG